MNDTSSICRNQYDAIWTARYKELIAYKDKWSNTLVATSYPVLGVWVGTQRKQYRLKTKGKYSHMTDERMKLLNEIGFVWEVNTWNEKFEELKHFRMQYGHFLVPTGKCSNVMCPRVSLLILLQYSRLILILTHATYISIRND